MKARLDDQIQVIPMKGSTEIIFAPLHKLELPKQSGQTPLRGRLITEIAYGPNRDDLRYLFEYEGEPMIGMKLVAIEGNPVGTAELTVVTAIRRLNHRKL